MNAKETFDGLVLGQEHMAFTVAVQGHGMMMVFAKSLADLTHQLALPTPHGLVEVVGWNNRLGAQLVLVRADAVTYIGDGEMTTPDPEGYAVSPIVR